MVDPNRTHQKVKREICAKKISFGDTHRPGASSEASPHVASAHVPENMAEDEEDDPVVAEVCYITIVNKLPSLTKRAVLQGIILSYSSTGGRLFGPDFGQQALLVSGSSACRRLVNV